jgi:hypothetical protein
MADVSTIQWVRCAVSGGWTELSARSATHPDDLVLRQRRRRRSTLTAPAGDPEQAPNNNNNDDDLGNLDNNFDNINDDLGNNTDPARIEAPPTVQEGTLRTASSTMASKHRRIAALRPTPVDHHHSSEGGGWLRSRGLALRREIETADLEAMGLQGLVGPEASEDAFVTGCLTLAHLMNGRGREIRIGGP